MSLIAETKKLRELEQRASPANWRLKKLDVGKYAILAGDPEFYIMQEIFTESTEEDPRFITENRNLAPAMLEVLGMFREGDAERLERAAERLIIEAIGWREEDRLAAKEDIAAYRRLQKMAALMEKEEREG